MRQCGSVRYLFNANRGEPGQPEILHAAASRRSSLHPPHPAASELATITRPGLYHLVATRREIDSIGSIERRCRPLLGPAGRTRPAFVPYQDGALFLRPDPCHGVAQAGAGAGQPLAQRMAAPPLSAPWSASRTMPREAHSADHGRHPGHVQTCHGDRRGGTSFPDLSVFKPLIIFDYVN